MGDHGQVVYETATGNDYAEHEGTYRMFTGLVKWGTIATVAICALMAIFLV